MSRLLIHARLGVCLLAFFAAPSGHTIAPPQPLGVFSPTAPLPEAAYDTTLTPLADGTILLTDANGAWRFDPGAGSYQTVGPFAAAHPVAAAAALLDGRVLVLGTGSPAPGVAAEIFDPATNAFVPTGVVQMRRYQAHLVRLLDGRVLVLGGQAPAPDNSVVTQAEIFDPASNSFALTGAQISSRLSNTATLLNTGDVLLTGGTDNQGHAYATAEIYRTQTGIFQPTGTMSAWRVNQAASLLRDGSVLVTGGFGDPINGNGDSHSTGIVQASAERYIPATGLFVSVANVMSDSRQYHTATSQTDGSVLIAGGQDDYTNLVADADLYDPGTQRFNRITSPMVVPRAFHVAVLLGDSRTVLSSGRIYNSTESQLAATRAVEIFAPDAIFRSSFGP